MFMPTFCIQTTSNESSGKTFYEGCQVIYQKFYSRRLTHFLKSDVGEVEFFIVRFMVAPHDKDNLEPLGAQGAQRLRMVMAFIPLAAVVELGPLAVVKRNKRKPVQRVAQMFVASKTEWDHATLATGLGH